MAYHLENFDFIRDIDLLRKFLYNKFNFISDLALFVYNLCSKEFLFIRGFAL